MRLDFCNISIHLSRSKLLSAANRSLPFNETKTLHQINQVYFKSKLKSIQQNKMLNKIRQRKNPQKDGKEI